MDDVIFYYDAWALWQRDAIAAASLQSCARANAPAELYWLRPFLDDVRYIG